MRNQGETRRAIAVLAVALGVLGFSAAGAGAAGVKPPALTGIADAEAVHVKLTLPGTAELLAALRAAGVPVPSLPSEGLVPSITVEQAISLTHATSVSGTASGFARPASGLVTLGEAASSCSKPKCSTEQSVAALKMSILEQLNGGIGTVEVAGARSRSTSPRDTENATAIATVNLSLAKLLAIPELAPVRQALQDLIGTVNGIVRDNVNPALDSLRSTVDKTLNDNGLKDVNDALKSIVTTGPINPLPDITTGDLLNLTVLGGRADVVSSSGTTLEAIGESKVADVRILDDWVTIQSIVAKARTFVDLNAQRKADSIPTTGAGLDKAAKSLLSRLPVDAIPSLTVSDIDLGGLLKIKAPESQLLNDAAFNSLKEALRKDAPAGLEQAVEEVIAALDILYNTAGVTLERVAGVREVQRPFSSTTRTRGTEVESAASLALRARAQSDRLVLTVAPKIPMLAGKLPSPSAIVPRLGPSDYVPTGIKLEVTLPQASSQVAQGAAVLGFNIARTGVGIHWIAVGILLGAAIVVRRFAMAK